MAGPTDRVPSPQVVAPTAEPPAKSADHAPAQSVRTQWNLDYDGLFPAPGDRSQVVQARTPESAVYLDLKVAPDGDPGRDAPAQVEYSGIDLSRSGAAHLGAFAHPKGRGGKVHGSIAYGKRPTFAFTLKSTSLRGSAAANAHRQLAEQWSSLLDDFVTEQQAEALLQNLVTTAYPDGDVTVRVVRTDHAGPLINPTSLNYKSVDADRTFNLKLAIPTAAKDRVVVRTSSSSGEHTTGTEDTRNMTVGTEVTASSASELTLLSQVRTTLDAGLSALSNRIIESALSTDMTTSHTEGNASKSDNTVALKGSINGTAELKPGDLIRKIPVAGNVVGDVMDKLLNAKLNISLDPNLSTDFGLDWTNSSQTFNKLGTENRSKVALEVASNVRTQTEKLMSTSLKNSIAAATKLQTANTTGDKTSGGSRTSNSDSFSETRGTVEIVRAAPQPSIVEE